MSAAHAKRRGSGGRSAPGPMKRSLVGIVVLLLALTGCTADSPELSEGAEEIEAKDFSFVPEDLAVQTGSVTFAIRNTGNEIHEFELFEETKLLDEVEDITPGLTRELTITLEAGTYEYACKFEDHYERGMKGTLKVS